MKKLDSFKDKRILILGFGREGIDSLNFFRKIFPKKILGVADRLTLKELSEQAKKEIKRNKKIKLHLGENYLQSLKSYDVIVKSPGIPPKIIKPFLRKGQKITSQTEIFFQNCPGKIIGVTGTKGKSTTASLIHKIFKENKLKSYLVGNNGKPALSFLRSAKEESLYIYELSSHQLFGLKKSPHIGVLLNIYPEHLDYYRNFNEYANAKANITNHQNKRDFFVFNSKNKLVEEISKKSKAKKIPLKSIKMRKVKTSLKGKFNLNNIKAATAVGRIFGLSNTKIIGAIKKFKPLPYRLEYIGTYKGIRFYNDALSTIPEATIAALDALGNNVQTIFLGGFDRGISFENLAKRIIKSKIKTMILFPETGEKIWREAIRISNKIYKAFLVSNMADGVKVAFKSTKKGKICLLSTASASFSLFKDYKEKGDLFKKYVKKYGKGG